MKLSEISKIISLKVGTIVKERFDGSLYYCKLKKYKKGYWHADYYLSLSNLENNETCLGNTILDLNKIKVLK